MCCVLFLQCNHIITAIAAVGVIVVAVLVIVVHSGRVGLELKVNDVSNKARPELIGDMRQSLGHGHGTESPVLVQCFSVVLSW